MYLQVAVSRGVAWAKVSEEKYQDQLQGERHKDAEAGMQVQGVPHSPPLIPQALLNGQRGTAMSSLLKAAAAGLALGVLTLSATASAHAADPEGRFRISAQMDGSLDPSPNPNSQMPPPHSHSSARFPARQWRRWFRGGTAHW